jgi:glutathione S-transferase
MTLRLYQFAPSPFCAKVSKILEYKGLEFETIEVDYLERKELLLVSGQLLVPVLTFADGEPVADSHRIAIRLEELYPEPTILPPELAGLHLALTRYVEGELNEILMRVALPAVLQYYRRRGPEREAFYRLLRDREHGAGFCEHTIQAHAEFHARARQALEPLESALQNKAFLLGRIGLADFALYGQLHPLRLGGTLELPGPFSNLSAFFARMDQISSRLEPTP